MGRRAKGWYPNQLNDRRKQQEQRPIAAAPGSMDIADEYPASATVPPPSSTNLGMSTSLPSRSRGATPGPSRVSSARPNRSKANRTRSNENLCMRILRPDQTEAVARVLLVDHMKYIGISEEFVTRNGIFSIELREDKKKYIAEGPGSTGILYAESSADITILHPSRDPSKTVLKRALVFRPESSGQPNHDIRVPRRMRHLCEPMIEDVFGLEVATLSDPGDFSLLLGPQQHTCVSGGAACRSCFDHAMLASSIDLPYRPGQHSLPHGGYGPPQAAPDSSLTAPSYQPPPGADDGRWDDGMQSTSQQPWDYGQWNDGMQSTNQWLYDDGTQSTSQQPWDDGQGNYGMQSSSQRFWGPSSNM
ncbi:hypothetical protein LRP88_05286 [Fusarium phalaenopsidis]